LSQGTFTECKAVCPILGPAYALQEHMENTNRQANEGSARHCRFMSRGFLGIGSAALAAAGMVPAMSAAGQEGTDRSRSDPGPANPTLDAHNPDSVLPPNTDYGGVPTFNSPFSFANKRLFEGGWSREVTVRELPHIQVHRLLLEMFKSCSYQDLSVSEWLAHTPPELVMAHLRQDKAGI
jgi:hypothetical protein